jgi:hypothetical protein
MRNGSVVDGGKDPRSGPLKTRSREEMKTAYQRTWAPTPIRRPWTMEFGLRKPVDDNALVET